MDRNVGRDRPRENPSSARERYYALSPSASDGGATLLAVFFAIALLLFVAALSARQATQPAPAHRVLVAGIASLTDIDLLLAEHGSDLKRQAESGSSDTFRLPGYPIDIALSRNEVTKLSQQDLRELILARSAAVVYGEGLKAFDQTGRQSLSLFSAQGALDFAVGRISKDTNSTARTATTSLALLTAALALAVVMRGEGYRRLRTLGLGVVAGALPGFLIVVALRFVAEKLGGDDPFVAQLREIVATLLAVPLRNYLVVAVLGAVITALGPAFGLFQRRLASPDDEGTLAWQPEDEFAGPDTDAPGRA
jgi:hypothetical protein